MALFSLRCQIIFRLWVESLWDKVIRLPPSLFIILEVVDIDKEWLVLESFHYSESNGLVNFNRVETLIGGSILSVSVMQ